MKLKLVFVSDSEKRTFEGIDYDCAHTHAHKPKNNSL